MTIKECIDKTDNLNPNQYTEEQKVDWLSRLDYQIFHDIILGHEPEFIPFTEKSPIDQDVVIMPPMPPRFEPYTVDNMSKELLVRYPFDELYIAYLNVKIAEAQQETSLYNNAVTLYQGYYDNFVADYRQKHKPINRARFNNWRH